MPKGLSPIEQEVISALCGMGFSKAQVREVIGASRLKRSLDDTWAMIGKEHPEVFQQEAVYVTQLKAYVSNLIGSSLSLGARELLDAYWRGHLQIAEHEAYFGALVDMAEMFTCPEVPPNEQNLLRYTQAVFGPPLNRRLPVMRFWEVLRMSKEFPASSADLQKKMREHVHYYYQHFLIPPWPAEAKKLVEAMLETIPPRMKNIVAMRYGLLGYQPHTQKHIGEKLGISGNRVGQLEAKALRMLRHPARTEPVNGLFFYR